MTRTHRGMRSSKEKSELTSLFNVHLMHTQTLSVMSKDEESFKAVRAQRTTSDGRAGTRNCPTECNFEIRDMRNIVGISLPFQSKSSLKSTYRGLDLVLRDCVWLSPVVGI